MRQIYSYLFYLLNYFISTIDRGVDAAAYRTQMLTSVRKKLTDEHKSDKKSKSAHEFIWPKQKVMILLFQLHSLTIRADCSFRCDSDCVQGSKVIA